MDVEKKARPAGSDLYSSDLARDLDSEDFAAEIDALDAAADSHDLMAGQYGGGNFGAEITAIDAPAEYESQTKELTAMLKFELSIVDSKLSIKDAIAETIESGKSGLLVQQLGQPLGLVNFDRLVEADMLGLELVEEVAMDPVADVQSMSDMHIDSKVRSVGMVFGILGQRGDVAQLYSISEQKGGPYTSASSGGRCKRPGKPPQILPRNWFHYYPPTSRSSIQPNICKFDNTQIS